MNVARVLIAAGLIAFVFNLVDINNITHLVKKINVFNFCYLIFLNFATLFLSSIKLNLLFENINFKSILRISLLSQASSILAFGQATQEVVRGLYLIKSEKLSWKKVMAGIATDKLISLLALIILGSIGILMSAYSSYHFKLTVFLVPIAISLIAYLILNLFGLRLIDCLRKYQFFNSEFLQYFRSMKNISVLRKNLFWSICFQIISVLFYYAVSEILDIKIEFWDWCWINAVLTLILFIPLSLMGVGIKEVSLIFLMGIFGVKATEAIAFSLILYGVQLIFIICCILIYYLLLINEYINNRTSF
jgi:hypothetical protein